MNDTDSCHVCCDHIYICWRPVQVEANGAGASIFGDWLANEAKPKIIMKGQYWNNIAPMIVSAENTGFQENKTCPYELQ